MLGATVHQCTPQIDGGLIYAVSRAAMKDWRKEWIVRRKIKKGLIRNYLARHIAGIPVISRV